MNALWINLLLAQAGEDPAVVAARKALSKWQWPRRYPWYDSANDSVAPVDLSEPWYMRWNLDWLADWLDSLRFGSVGPLSMSWIQWVAWLGIALLIAVVIYLMVRAYRRRQKQRAVPLAAGSAASNPADDRRRVEALPLDGRKRSDFLAEAARHYQAGNYGEAIIYLFSHQLVELDKHQLIHLAKGKTNRQYLRELRQRLPLRRLLEQTMVAFEDVFFGNHPLDRSRFEACWFRLDEFEALMAKGTP